MGIGSLFDESGPAENYHLKIAQGVDVVFVIALVLCMHLNA